MKKQAKIIKIEPFTPQWQREANNLARTHCPTIYPCKECGHPVMVGYCCGTCGSKDPR